MQLLERHDSDREIAVDVAAVADEMADDAQHIDDAEESEADRSAFGTEHDQVA